MAKREPNGRIQRVQEESPTEVRRLRDAALSGMRDPVWGTELGRLYLVGKINSTMFAAGKKWAEMASKYGEALLSPTPDPKAMCLDRAGGSPIDPDSYEGKKEVRRHIRAVESFVDAYAALKSTSLSGFAPSTTTGIVRSVCERNEMLPGHWGLLALCGGLSTLALFWGLTDSRKSLSDRSS
jgi:hypothetical protein